jgi:predicted SAM-dependent methyltransferase
MRLESVNEVTNQICFFCGNSKNHIKGKFDEVPLVLGCGINKKIEDKFIGFNVYQCDICGLLFTDTDLNEEAYSGVHSEAVGGIWNLHHKELSNFIKNEKKDSGFTLEIGPSNNPISRENTIFVDLFEKIPFDLKNNEEYHHARFPDFDSEVKFSTIIASHVFEHSLDPTKFLLKCKNLLEKNGSIFLSIPNFEIWINEKYWNGITPEHQIYPTIKQVKEICNKLKLKLKYIKFENHSVFFKISDHLKNNDVKTNDEDLKINEWIDSINESVNYLEKELSKYDNSNIFITGASHISQYPILISSKIKERISFVLDNSKSKHQKRLYGTEIYCKPFEFIENLKKPLIAVFNSPYQNEMIKQILSINDKSIIIKC